MILFLLTLLLTEPNTGSFLDSITAGTTKEIHQGFVEQYDRDRFKTDQQLAPAHVSYLIGLERPSIPSRQYKWLRPTIRAGPALSVCHQMGRLVFPKTLMDL